MEKQNYKEQEKIQAINSVSDQTLDSVGNRVSKTAKQLIKDAEIIYQWLIKDL